MAPASNQRPPSDRPSEPAVPAFSKTLLVYGAGSALRRLAGLLLVPIYTRALAPGDYGVLALLGVLSAVYANLADLGVTHSILRFHVREANEAARRQVLSACLHILALAAAPSLIAAALSPGIARVLLDDPRLYLLVALSIGSTWLELLVRIPMAPLRSRQESGQFVRINLALTTLTLGLSILLVVVFHLGVLGVVLAQLFTNAAAAVWLLARRLPRPLPRPERAMMTAILRYGLPLVPSGLGQVSLRMADRYVLRLFEPLSAVGVYSLGYRIGEVVTTAAEAFWTAWAPFAFRVAREEGGPRRLAEVGHAWAAVTMLMGLLLVLFSREAIWILTPPAYHGAAAIVPIVVLGLTFSAFYPVAEIPLLIAERTARIPAVNGSAAVLNLGLTLLLVPRLHMAGAAWATAIAYALQTAGMLWVGRGAYPLPLSYPRLGLAALGTVAVGLTALRLQEQLTPIFAVAMKALLLGAAVGWMFLLRLITLARWRGLITWR